MSDIRETIVRDAALMMVRYPDWRIGQAVFNVACAYRCEAANALRGTSLDPFYSDDRIEAFLDALAAQPEAGDRAP